MSQLPPPLWESVRHDLKRGDLRHALFDFDGTLSVIRQGWQSVMAPLMMEHLTQTVSHEPAPQLERAVTEFIDQTTGQQTIYQMVGLADMVRERGGRPLEPLEYKRQYLQRLWEKIEGRVRALEDGTVARETMMVPGAVDILAALTERGVRLYLASGTDVANVRHEAEALGLAHYFEGRIYGAVDHDWDRYSKARIIADILAEHRLEGHQLVTFGDGYVEIEETVKVGGLAVGVASDEERRSGDVDPWKRDRLIRAGAHLIVPDLRHARQLVAYLQEDAEG
jgi:phosphoglycolate phosphatase